MQQERIQAKQSPLRCPFCHEGVEVESEEWVACTGCLARHHDSCWKESGGCAACSETSCLTSGEVGTRVEDLPHDPKAREIARLIDAHERASEGSIFDYLLAPITLGLYPLLKAESRLIRHAGSNERALLPGPETQAERAERYRRESMQGVARGARARMAVTLVLFGLCALAVIPVLALLSSYYYGDQEVGAMVGLLCATSWWAWTLISSGLHWRAVREHDSKQLYLALLSGQASEEDARDALADNREAWTRQGRFVFFGTVFSAVFWPILPFWLARSTRIPLDLHERREDSIAEIQKRAPKDVSEPS